MINLWCYVQNKKIIESKKSYESVLIFLNNSLNQYENHSHICMCKILNWSFDINDKLKKSNLGNEFMDGKMGNRGNGMYYIFMEPSIGI